ncbi:cysteine desulfurase family protein, partial [candidate division KSB1 bacterium]
MRVYLDHNATTPLHPCAREAMLPCLEEVFGNPSSSHSWGQQARAALESARADLAALIGAQRDEIIFTSGGTESINLALAGVMAAKTSGRIVTTTVEHPAVTETLSSLEADGHEVVRLAVDEDGCLDPDNLEKLITPDVNLVSVMLANHEVGALQPVAQAAQAAKRVGAVFHTDAVQALGKIEIDVDSLGVDLLSISAHKAYGPKGVGALYVRTGTDLAPTLFGGKQEKGLRAGTENVAAAVGFAAAAGIVVGELDSSAPRLQKLSQQLFDSISTRIPGLIW